MSTYSIGRDVGHNAVFGTDFPFLSKSSTNLHFLRATVFDGPDDLSLSEHLDRLDPRFKEAWELYRDAFPRSERRGVAEQNAVMSDPRYRFSAIVLAGKVVGMIALWQLQHACFIEHFAIAKDARSNGLGKRVLTLLKTRLHCPLILDVEPLSTSQQAVRRIAFYLREGFHYTMKPVVIPAYLHAAEEPSNFMAWPRTLSPHHAQCALTEIKRIIYHLPLPAQHIHHAS